jgi:hypothetical protein
MRRLKVAKPARCRRLRAVVEAKLELGWSPQQIASWLVLEFPDDAEMRVSHETIYLSLFVQSRGALRKELTRYLRMKRSVRRHGGKPARNGQSHIPAMVNISERPAEAADRAVLGRRSLDRPARELLTGLGPWASGAAGCRVDDPDDLVDGVCRNAGSRRVLSDAVLAGRDVEAEQLVAGDVALDPLDVAEVGDHAIALLAERPNLFRADASGAGDVALDHVLGHR